MGTSVFAAIAMKKECVGISIIKSPVECTNNYTNPLHSVWSSYIWKYGYLGNAYFIYSPLESFMTYAFLQHTDFYHKRKAV